MPEETLVKIYVENLIVEETYLPNSAALKTHQQEIFAKYNISRQDYETSLNSYRDDSVKWGEFFKKANAYLDDLKKSNTIN